MFWIECDDGTLVNAEQMEAIYIGSVRVDKEGKAVRSLYAVRGEHIEWTITTGTTEHCDARLAEIRRAVHALRDPRQV